MSIRVSSAHFSGTSKVFGRDHDHLAAIVRGLAADNARNRSAQLNTGLTDNSGGTAGAGLMANPAPAAAAGAATTSAPKAGFDSELVKIANNVADLALRVNLLRGQNGMSLLTDSSGGTANTTLEALLVNLTAVDGSTGTAALDEASARLRMASVNNALSSLAAAVSDLAVIFGVDPLVDLIGGTVGTTIAAISASGTGVGGAGLITMLDAAVDAWLVINRDNVATLAGKLNAMVGTAALAHAPSVVAA
jgi:hypothetical protein